jgi:hypothetical protein
MQTQRKSYQINDTEEKSRFRLGIERRSDVRNRIRTMRKRNPEHYDGVRRAANHSPFAQAIRRLFGSGRMAQCAAGITIFFSNVRYQAIIVVLFEEK